MTEDDKRECKSVTLEELAECRAHRRCLVTKAEQMQRQIEAAGNVLRDTLEAAPGGNAAVAGQTPHEGDWPSYVDLVSVHKDMWETCNRIHVLSGRLREWGVID